MRRPSIYAKKQTLQFWESFSERFKHENSKNVYFGDINECMDLCERDFLEITKKEADSYHNYLMKKISDGLLEKTTLKKKIKELHKFSEYILENQKTDQIPSTFQNFFYSYAIQYFKDEDLKSIPSLHDIDKLLECAKNDFMLYTILILVQRMGLKSSSLCELKPEDIIKYQEDYYILIQKGKNKEPYFIPEDAWNIVSRYLDCREKNEYLFYNKWGRKLNIQYLSDKMKKLSSEAGVKQYSITDIRNTFGVAMFTYGVNPNHAAKQMGISSWHVERYHQPILSQTLMKQTQNLVHIKVLPPEV